MIGIIDIGNTSIHCATYDGYKSIKEKKLNEPSLVKEFFSGTEEVLIISVNPPLNKEIKETLHIPVLDFPSSLIKLDNYISIAGADRLANGLGAAKFYKLPAIIIDCGSAITIDLFTKIPFEDENAYLVEFNGGAIIPGLNWYFSALRKGKNLPEITPGIKEKIGNSTKDCLYFGAYGSFIGGIKEILNRLNCQDKNIIFTGGDGKRFSSIFGEVYDPLLTLKGGIVAYYTIR